MKKQEFHFALGEPGTAVATYVVDGIESEFELTNVCNPLGDMLCAIAQLLTNPSQIWEGSNTAAFTWYSEDDSYEWTINVQSDEEMTVRATQTNDFFGDEGVEIINTKCKIDDFVGCIVAELDKFIKSIGLLNYQQQWQTAEFPLTYFLILKRRLIEKGRWTPDVMGDSLNISAETQILMA
ncbi:MAG: hypothetical protein II375_08495 [Bacteroidales bacterium]|nr:hypothetical protein [Bacteroidales bacterium]